MDEKRRRNERERKVVMIIILIDSVVFDCIFPNVVVVVVLVNYAGVRRQKNAHVVCRASLSAIESARDLRLKKQAQALLSIVIIVRS